MSKFWLWMLVACVGAGTAACSSDEGGGGSMNSCTAPLQLLADGTCGCAPGTQLVGTTCQPAATGCPAGMMPDPANPSACVPVATGCPAGMMPDPANPSACVPMATGCPAGMMPDPANPSACVPTEPAASCAEADTSGDTYEAMQVMVTMRCGVCHRRSQAGRSAGLQLTGEMAMDRADDLLALVDKPACEVDMPVVDRSGGDAALANSWLYWKVAGEAASFGMLQARPEWTSTGEACAGLDPAGTFGALMPLGIEEPIESAVAAVRNWICAGAPGPADGTMSAAGAGGGMP